MTPPPPRPAEPPRSLGSIPPLLLRVERLRGCLGADWKL